MWETRYYVGQGGVEKDEDKALAMLQAIVRDPAAYGASPAHRGRAFSLMSHMHWDLRVDAAQRENPAYDARREKWRMAHVLLAGMCADEACKLGYVSAQIIGIAGNLEAAGLSKCTRKNGGGTKDSAARTRRGKGGEAEIDPDFMKFEHLWTTWEAQKRAIEEEHREQLRKVLREPHAYVCALEGCGVHTRHRGALMRCAGRCDVSAKPAYCSKECQVEVRVLPLALHFVFPDLSFAFVRAGLAEAQAVLPDRRRTRPARRAAADAPADVGRLVARAVIERAPPRVGEPGRARAVRPEEGADGARRGARRDGEAGDVEHGEPARDQAVQGRLCGVRAGGGGAEDEGDGGEEEGAGEGEEGAGGEGEGDEGGEVMG